MTRITVSKNGESGHPYHFPGLRIKAIQSFTGKYNVSYGLLVDALNEVENITFLYNSI